VTLRQLIRSDLARFAETAGLRGQRYRAWKVAFESFVFKPGFQAALLYRLSHWCHQRGFTYVAWFLTRTQVALTGAEIEFNAVIGPGLFITHPVGIVIGRGTRIGKGATIFHGVTFGARSWHPDEITRFPEVGDDCFFFANASALGGIRIGNECVLAAHTLVTHDMPAGSLARGVPATIVPERGAAMRREWMGPR
jgi:serine O-acetyltransferase